MFGKSFGGAGYCTFLMGDTFAQTVTFNAASTAPGPRRFRSDHRPTLPFEVNKAVGPAARRQTQLSCPAHPRRGLLLQQLLLWH
ncbi:hypothetical protein GCM10012285_27930 [Streptomyces kronopolitis]|uniref:Uncharacterized protein n=1 Tax=Streptomyces kronopolitis TaxID=1612435 RepID=A0ABQ2JEH7_9ACTN|nr:hypothetical protein GCM10012285_27930 [Streptomyces kronopolitis]